MIIGNPYEFAILVQHIPEWGDDFYRNGLFHLIIDGKMFPEKLCTASLGVEFGEINSSNALISFPENREIFHAEKEDAFKAMLFMAYPDYRLDYGGGGDDRQDCKNEYLYKISGQNSEENGYYLFCVTCNDEARVLGAKVGELISQVDGTKDRVTIQQLDISEIIVPTAEIKRIVQQLNDYDLSTRLRK